MGRKAGLPPIADAGTRLFILGSLPGERSLAESRYYAHPTNQFWKLVGHVIGVELHALEYCERLEQLKMHGIGLWDVVSAASREGSGDHAIRDAAHNDIGGLKRDFPQLRAIGLNGGFAAKEGMRLLSGIEGLVLVALPSSSAANAGMPLAKKAAAWSRLGEFILAPNS